MIRSQPFGLFCFDVMVVVYWIAIVLFFSLLVFDALDFGDILKVIIVVLDIIFSIE